MKTLSAIVLGLIATTGIGLAGGSSPAWNKSNLDALRGLDKPGVVALLAAIPGNDALPVPGAQDINEFMWADLQGNGSYELLVTYDVNKRGFYNAILIYTRNGDRVRWEEIRGWNIEDLPKVTRDIDGDGKDELIIPSQLPSDTYRGAAGMAIWPAVYRLKDGQYMEASGDFPAFYESEVLPALQERVAAREKNAANRRATEHQVAIAEMARDKALRIIGKDPTAGLNRAREWMMSSDPQLRQDAAAVLGDIGGQEDDLRRLAADQDPRVSMAARFAARNGAGSFKRFNSAVIPGPRG